MVVHDFAVRPDGEIGSDQARGPFKLSLSAVHPPVDSPVLQARVRAGPKIALAYRAEPQRMASAEMDSARFEEAGFARECHYRLEAGFAAGDLLESRCESRILHRRRDTAASGGCFR